MSKPPPHRCPADICNLCNDFAEASRDDRIQDVEDSHYYIGNFDPDFHFPRGLAPRGL